MAAIAIAVAGAALAGGVVSATGGPRSGDGQAESARCLVASAAGSQGQSPAQAPTDADVRRARDAARREGAAREGAARESAPPRGGRAPSAMPPFDFGWGAAKNRADLPSPTPAEWADVQNLMSRVSPLRQAAVDAMPDDDDKKESIKRFVFARYRTLQALKKRDLVAYDQRLRQLTIEDQIFGLVSSWSGRGVEPQQQGQQLREALRPQVSRLVEIDLGERRRRVEWLKKELADQSALLDRDEKDRDGLIDRRVERFAKWADLWAARRARQDGTQGKTRPGDGTPNVEALPSRQPAAPTNGRQPD